jgi:putative inorganic carbon (HCO3(-)) transporter
VTRQRIPVFLTGAAAAATVVSIAAFEILMGFALVALLLTPETRRAWRWPPVTIPLLLWFTLTAVSAAASGHAAAALPQFKKFYIYLMLFLAYTAFRKFSEIRWLVTGWALGASLSASWSGVQLARQFSGYTSYVESRATGFMGHWMTFGGEMMMSLVLIAALLLLSREPLPYKRVWVAGLLAAGALASFGLLASYSRSMWLGAFVGIAYIVWVWRRWMVAAIPVLAGAILLANPFDVRERAISAFRPHGDLDSNRFRAVTREIGWEMIKAHPWFGVGPEQVGPQHERYIPAGSDRPLPTGYYGHLHNIYIHYAAERGVPALFALLWVLGKALADFSKAAWKRPAPGVWVLHAAIAVMLSIMISGWYELNLGDSEVLGLFLAVMGCGYVAASPDTVLPSS